VAFLDQMHEFSVIRQIREFCESSDGRKKITALLIHYGCMSVL